MNGCASLLEPVIGRDGKGRDICINADCDKSVQLVLSGGGEQVLHAMSLPF